MYLNSLQCLSLLYMYLNSSGYSFLWSLYLNSVEFEICYYCFLVLTTYEQTKQWTIYSIASQTKNSRGDKHKILYKNSVFFKSCQHNTRIDFSTSEASRALAQGYKNRQKVILNNIKDIAVFYII